MTTNEETTNNTPSTSETTPDTHATSSLYIKLDWGAFRKEHDMRYVYNADPRTYSLDVRLTVYYRGTIDAKIIKYIYITVQVYDRVDEPIGEPFEKKLTGPFEPKNSCIYDYDHFLNGDDYNEFGSLKVVKIIITYMDKTDEEITNEDTIKAMCTSFLDKGLELPTMTVPTKIDPPEEPPIFMQFDLGQSHDNTLVLNNLVYIGNKDSKTIRFIDLFFKTYDCAHEVHGYHYLYTDPIRARSKTNGLFRSRFDLFSDRVDNLSSENFLIDTIVITYEDNTYVEIPERMIEAMTSKENVDKAEKQLEEILHKEEEAKKAKKAKQKECCSELKNRACIFLQNPNDLTAASLLTVLVAWCTNDEKLTDNYLTKELVAYACSVALQKIAFDTNNNVILARREEAKAFLARFAPEMNSEEAYTQAKRKAEEEQRKAREEEEAKARRKREEEVRKAQEEAKRKIEKKLEEEEAKTKKKKLIKDALKAIFWWLILFPLLSGIVCYIIVSIFLTR